MAKGKPRAGAQSRSPLEVAARDSIPDASRQNQSYKLVRFAEKDFEGGISLNNMRLERLACVKALEGLARKHPKRKIPVLQAYQLMAANAYHADLEALQGHQSSTFRERVDSLTRKEGGLIHRLDKFNKINYIKHQLNDEQAAVLAIILQKMPDKSLAEIWPNRTQRNRARNLIQSALHELALIYGLVKY
ncbi:MAG: hypothetical protein HKN36_08110 [Hellea sp.]|nr:hypothetical protein [Hellea sp.]